MPKGPNRLILDRYLDTAQEGTLTGSGSDWKKKADALRVLADAMMAGAEQAELRIGEQTLTGPALRKGMEDSATSMADKSDQLRAAGDALVQVGTQIGDTREARDSMKDLGEKPSPYQPPAGTPGVPLTPDEINAQAAASQARQGERASWQDAFDKQEARALALTRQMDSAFLGAIPPMKAIHGQEDPTEPPPNVPSGPGGPLLPGTRVPTGGGGGGGGVLGPSDPKDPHNPEPREPEPREPEPREPEPREPEPREPEPKEPIPRGPIPTEPTPKDPSLPPTTNVTGTSQTGVTYNPGGAHRLDAGLGLREPGHVDRCRHGCCRHGRRCGCRRHGRRCPRRQCSRRPRTQRVRPGARHRRDGSLGQRQRPLPRRECRERGRTADRSGQRLRHASRCSWQRRRSWRRSRSWRRGAGAAGSRSGGSRGAGARSAAGSAAGGRGGRKGDREQTTDRDSLVYDQDWLGDDDVAPGVLD